MARKSYDQRLKERWKQKQKQEKIRRHNILEEFSQMDKIYAATAWIMPFLFGKRGR